MRTMTLEEAIIALTAYPKVKAAIEREGAAHVERLAGHITNDAVRARLATGRITSEEDVPATGPTTLEELERKIAEGRDDTAMFVAACYVYLAHLTRQAA